MWIWLFHALKMMQHVHLSLRTLNCSTLSLPGRKKINATDDVLKTLMSSQISLIYSEHAKTCRTAELVWPCFNVDDLSLAILHAHYTPISAIKTKLQIAWVNSVVPFAERQNSYSCADRKPMDRLHACVNWLTKALSRSLTQRCMSISVWLGCLNRVS